MRKIAAEMPRLAELSSPPPVPILSVSPAIGTSPTSLSFTAQQGGGNPAAQALTISNTGGGTLNWSASDSATWLSLSSVSGTGNGVLTASVTTGTLVAGSYSGTVTLSATGTAPVTIPVALTITAAPVSPAIGMSPTSLSFTAQAGINPAAQTLTVRNTGGGTLSWSSSDSAAWLSLSPASGTGNGVVTASVTTGTLTAGTYSGTITVSATGTAPVTIPVALTVTAAPAPPTIGMSPTSLSFTTLTGTNPATQALTISNTGGGTLSWNASDNAAWLSLSSASGTGNGVVTASVTTGTLAAGSYSGTITVSGAGTASVTIPVALTVTAAPVPPAIGMSPTSLSFSTQAGTNPATQALTISNAGGGTLTWSASDNAAWLSLSPASGTGNGIVTASVTTGTLTAGSYSGTITVSGAGTTSVTIPVAFTVTAAPLPPAFGMSPMSLSFTAPQGGGNPTPQTLSISNTGGGTLSWSVSNNAAWASHSPTSGTGNGMATITVTTGSLTAGTYNGVVTLYATGATSVTVPVAFTVTPVPTIALSPSSLSYAATQGAANPANQNISLNNSGGTLNWTVSDDASWLAVSPASGSSSSTLTTSVNTSGLTAGTYSGILTVSAAGTTSKTVTVTLTVNAPATSSATLTWNGNTDSDLAGYKVYRATSSGGYGAPIATLQGNVTTYVAAGLQSGTTYFFVITSYDSAGNESSRSNEVSKSIF